MGECVVYQIVEDVETYLCYKFDKKSWSRFLVYNVILIFEFFDQNKDWFQIFQNIFLRPCVNPKYIFGVHLVKIGPVGSSLDTDF